MNPITNHPVTSLMGDHDRSNRPSSVISERGLAFSDLSLCLNADPELVVGCLDFKKSRTKKNCYTGETVRFLKLCVTMTHPGTGLLWKNASRFARHPYFEHRLPSYRETDGCIIELNTPEERWRELCKRSCETFSLMIKKLRKRNLIKKAKDSGEPIQGILDHPHPWQVLFIMEQRMWQEPIPITWSLKDQAVEFVARLWISFLIRYPFRIGTYERLLLRNFVTVAGVRQMWVEPEQFKNHHFLKDQIYKVALDGFLLPLIDLYETKYRPALYRENPSEHFFILCNLGKTQADPRHYFEIRMANMLQAFTQHYLPEYAPSGFRPQAVRDIIATHLILEDPVGGWTRAAIALWDQEATIHSHYAHLEKVDFIRFHAAMVAKMTSAYAAHACRPASGFSR